MEEYNSRKTKTHNPVGGCTPRQRLQQGMVATTEQPGKPTTGETR
ncbi:MAG: hypothetical protein ABIN01_09280 [Ferruginibacter sp.]